MQGTPLKYLKNYLWKYCLGYYTQRFTRYYKNEVAKQNFGFKDRLGTKEAVFCLNTLVQNCLGLDQRRDDYYTFIDYQKSIDNVEHDIVAHNINIDPKKTD